MVDASLFPRHLSWASHSTFLAPWMEKCLRVFGCGVDRVNRRLLLPQSLDVCSCVLSSTSNVCDLSFSFFLFFHGGRMDTRDERVFGVFPFSLASSSSSSFPSRCGGPLMFSYLLLPFSHPLLPSSFVGSTWSFHRGAIATVGEKEKKKREEAFMRRRGCRRWVGLPSFFLPPPALYRCRSKQGRGEQSR